MPWVASTWTIETDAEASGGKVLRVVNGSQGRRALAWASLDDAAQYADVEIVYKWRTSATDGAVRAFCRGSGAQGSETAYYAGYQTAGNQANISKVVAGANTGMTFPAAPAIDTNTWYISRFRVAGSVLSFRTWAATSAEPGTWNGTTTDTDITDAGLVGLLPFGVATTEFDWVGVAFGGETAPMEAI